MGKYAETLGCKYLVNTGYKILKRNYFSRFGEIDIIAIKNSYIVFIEVRARKTSAMVSPKETVDKIKQTKIIKTAKMFLANNKTDLQPRFDVIEVDFKPLSETEFSFDINYIENAFWEESSYEIF